jgi:hypothetical protein
MDEPLLRTKLHIPIARSDPATGRRASLIPRPRLVEQLYEGLPGKLTNRVDPNPPLSRLRANRQLNELRSADLFINSPPITPPDTSLDRSFSPGFSIDWSCLINRV